MPSRKEILEYWEKNDPNLLFKNLDWDIQNDNVYDDRVNYLNQKNWDGAICFACGFEYGVERAHLIPVCDGGSDDPSNIHLLCESCHKKTEGIYNMPLHGKETYNYIIMNTPHYRTIRNEATEFAIKKRL